MKEGRDALKQAYIDSGKMQDPSKKVHLDDAIDFIGECLDMCPEFERHEREYQNALADFEKGIFCPNEPEFQAYYILSHLWQNEIVTSAELQLRPEVYSHPYVQLAIELQQLSQCGTDRHTQGFAGSMNLYSRGALRAMHKSYYNLAPYFPLSSIVRILGFDDADDAISTLDYYGIKCDERNGELVAMIGKQPGKEGVKKQSFDAVPASKGPEARPMERTNVVPEKLIPEIPPVKATEHFREISLPLPSNAASVHAKEKTSFSVPFQFTPSQLIPKPIMPIIDDTPRFKDVTLTRDTERGAKLPEVQFSSVVAMPTPQSMDNMPAERVSKSAIVNFRIPAPLQPREPLKLDINPIVHQSTVKDVSSKTPTPVTPRTSDLLRNSEDIFNFMLDEFVISISQSVLFEDASIRMISDTLADAVVDDVVVDVCYEVMEDAFQEHQEMEDMAISHFSFNATRKYFHVWFAAARQKAAGKQKEIEKKQERAVRFYLAALGASIGRDCSPHQPAHGGILKRGDWGIEPMSSFENRLLQSLLEVTSNRRYVIQ
ncbi:hypothetical protein HDU96_010146 [Phlyctochytrium bullatum]|nr:hypothetical protein HDU96_010146 [Phlyctochytrium bullatum]